MDLSLYDLQWFIYHKSKPNKHGNVLGVCGNLRSKSPGQQNRICLLISKPSGQGIQSEDIEEKGISPSKQAIAKGSKYFVFACTFRWGLVQNVNPSAEFRFESDNFKKFLLETDGPSNRRLWTNQSWSAWLLCHLLYLSEYHRPSINCFKSHFLSQSNPVQFWSDSRQQSANGLLNTELKILVWLLAKSCLPNMSATFLL